MKKNNFLFIILLLSTLGGSAQIAHKHDHNTNASIAVSIEKIKNDCNFYKGDTLNGFNLEGLIHESLRRYPMYSELVSYIKQRENSFVRKKYHLPKSQVEINETTNRLQINSVLAGSCNNLDFENGNYTGWTGGIGYNPSTNNPLVITSPAISTLGPNSAETSCSFHTLVSGGVDPYSGQPMVDPGGGTWACRLGGELLNIGCDTYNSSSSLYAAYLAAGFINPVVTTCTSNDPAATNTASPVYGRDCSNGESIQQTFLVTAANCLFSYNYSVVMANAPHSGDSCNYFRVQVFDGSGTLIPCLSYFVETDTTGNGIVPPGFLASGSLDALGNGVLYTPWTQNSLNLQPYIGQNITVKFTAAGCYLGGHFCYAYIDCSCGPLELLTPSGTVCQGGTQTIIGPPNGVGGTYSWSGPGIVSGAASQTVTANASGTYSLTITNQKGCAYTIDTTISFYPQPTVTVNSATICPGNTATLSATSTGGAGALTYSWSPPGGLSVTNDSITVVTGAASTSYTVTASSIHSCTNTAVATITIPSTNPPTYSAPAVCLGSPTIVNNTTGGSGTFNWDFGDATGVVVNQTSPTHTYATTGTFVISCTVNVGGCTATNTVNTTVNANPTVTVTSGTMCAGAGPVNLSANGANTYTWNTGATGAALNVSPATTTNYTVTGSTAAGCTNTAATSVSVTPNPTVTAAGSVICNGASGALSANGATTYTWTGSNLTSNNASNVTANPTTTSSYTVIGTQNTCTASAVTTITVNPTPTVTVVNMGPYCPGEAVPAATFTNNPNDPNTTYVWLNNNPAIGLAGAGSGLPNGFNAEPNATLANIYGVVTVTPTLNGCVGTPQSYTITIKPTPIANHIPNKEYCPNVNTTGIVFTAQPAGPTTFDWINTNNAIGLASSGTGNIPSFTTVNASGNNVTSTVHVVPTLNGCVGPDSSFVITIYPLPTPAFEYSKACEGDVTKMTDESTVATGQTIIYWYWDFNADGIFYDATNANPWVTLTPAGPHQIGLQVTTNKGCKNQVYETVYVNPIPTPALVGDQLSGCPNLPVIFTDQTPTNQGIVSWSWTFGNGQTSIAQNPTVVVYHNNSPYNSAFYDVTLTVTTDSGCSATATKPNYITVYPKPRAGFDYTPYDVDILDPRIYVHNTSVGANGTLPIQYYMGDVFIDHYDTANWSTLTNPMHVYNDQEAYTYQITQWVQNTYGCKDSVTHPVVINPVYTFYIPNAFSPNGDFRNEGFKGTGIGIDPDTYNIWVFDRWGNQIFHTKNMEETWNGTVNEHPVQEDVYVWKVRFKDVTGTKHELHGHVSLIR